MGKPHPWIPARIPALTVYRQVASCPEPDLLYNGPDWCSKPSTATIATITPHYGNLGTLVTITGKNLVPEGHTANSVTVVGVEAKLVSTSSTTIVIQLGIMKNDRTVSGDVVILSNKGQHKAALANSFKYHALGVIQKVSPSNGQLGASVKVGGINLLQGGTKIAKVTVNKVPVLSITSANDSAIEFVIGGLAGVKDVKSDVVLYADTGAMVSLAGGFVYNVPNEDTCKAAGVYYKDKATCMFPIEENKSCKGTFVPTNPCAKGLVCDKDKATCTQVPTKAPTAGTRVGAPVCSTFTEDFDCPPAGCCWKPAFAGAPGHEGACGECARSTTT